MLATHRSLSTYYTSAALCAHALAFHAADLTKKQFSRECVRLFGQPPRRDAERMREEYAETT
jgi:hypothetical protein